MRRVRPRSSLKPAPMLNKNMKILCPACNMEIPAANINLFEKIAKCSGCNNVFCCTGQLPPPVTGREERIPIGKPGNFIIERCVDGLQIVRRWFSPYIIFLAFFCLFWNGFLVVWFYIAFTQKQYGMALFGSLHAAVGLGMLYAVLTGLFNKTYIRISHGSLLVIHRPLPWLGQKNIPRQDLKQLYSKESVYPGEHGHSRRYSVQAITKKGQVIALVSNLASSEEALFIEQEIEKYLKIDDEPVRGEIPR